MKRIIPALIMMIFIFFVFNACDNTKKIQSSEKKEKNSGGSFSAGAPLPKDYTIKGRVKADNEDLTSKVSITCTTNTSDTSIETTTNADGYFVFKLPHKPIRFSISAISIKNPSIFSEPLLDLIPNGEDVNIVMTTHIAGQTGAIAEILIGGDLGKTNPGAKLVFMQNTTVVSTVIADANGRIFINNVPDGNYKITVSKQGFVNDTIMCHCTSTAGMPLNVSLQRQ